MSCGLENIGLECSILVQPTCGIQYNIIIAFTNVFKLLLSSLEIMKDCQSYQGIPTELGLSSNARVFSLLGNNMGGMIPTELGEQPRSLQGEIHC